MTHHYGKLPAGVRKHIRHEKARIRREFSTPQEREDAVKKLYNRFSYYLESGKSKDAKKSKEKPQKEAKDKAKNKTPKKAAK